jgi:aldose 1-epimerase
MGKTNTLGGLNKKDFQKIIDGKPVDLYILSNKKGAEVSITNWGGKIVSIFVPDKQGKWVDVVLGKRNIEDYTDANEPYFGAICGRAANRIANAEFSLDGQVYHLAKNAGVSSLHGGIKGFNSVVWEAKQPDGQTLELNYLAKDGEEGYPGNMQVTVIYKLTEDNALEIEFKATTDKATIHNLTNHSYFNLSGEGDPYVGDQELQINADYFMPTSDAAIPFGNFDQVEGTPFDFRTPHTIGERIEENHIQLIYGKGYDHNFILNKEGDELSFCAKAVSPKTGIVLEVYTTEPGVQLYTGNYLDGSFPGKNGHHYPIRSAFCLETQHFPDSIHHPEYPTTILRPGEVFRSKTIFKFSINY